MAAGVLAVMTTQVQGMHWLLMCANTVHGRVDDQRLQTHTPRTHLGGVAVPPQLLQRGLHLPHCMADLRHLTRWGGGGTQ